MKIVFFGKEFGLIVRDKLQEAGYRVVDPQDGEADLVVVGFYGSILPRSILEGAKYGALNVHPSLLPQYRGPTPVPTTILNGDPETGVTIIQMDEKADHGPILAQESFFVGEKKYTTPELRQILWEMGAELLLKTIPRWVAGEITPQEQNHGQATYTRKLTREDGMIDWSGEVEYIERQVRAYTPWPGTFTTWQGKTLKILKGRTQDFSENHTSLPPGTAIPFQDGFSVVTGKGMLVVEKLQMKGRSAVSAREFLLGYKSFLGSVLS